jgi:hypothetical protein
MCGPVISLYYTCHPGRKVERLIPMSEMTKR